MSQSKHAYSEKRDFFRMRIDTPIELFDCDNQQSYQGLCKDLSGAGMKVEVDQAITVGTALDASIKPSLTGQLSFTAKVEVSRVESMEDGSYHWGLAIREKTD